MLTRTYGRNNVPMAGFEIHFPLVTYKGGRVHFDKPRIRGWNKSP